MRSAVSKRFLTTSALASGKPLWTQRINRLPLADYRRHRNEERIEHFDEDSENPCRVAMFYHDRDSRGWLLSLCAALQDHFQGVSDFAFTWWKIQLLRDPVIAELASGEAARSDVLIYACHDAAIPEELKTFGELWLKLRGIRSGFLMALTGYPGFAEDGLSKWRCYLQEIAARARMEFAVQIVSVLTRENSEFTDQVTIGDLERRRGHKRSNGANGSTGLRLPFPERHRTERRICQENRGEERG